MTKQITLPQYYPTMQEATIVNIFKKENDAVKKGDVVMELTTEKSAVEMECPCDGVLIQIPINKGEDVYIGKILFVIETGDVPGGDDNFN